MDFFLKNAMFHFVITNLFYSYNNAKYPYGRCLTQGSLFVMVLKKLGDHLSFKG